MVHFVGAGPGACDLITVRGEKLLREADVIIYAGSLVNPELLKVKKESCKVYDSAYMTLEEVMKVIQEAEREEKMIVRLHTGDPSLYGAIKEQMDELDKRNIVYDICPGVSSFSGAAAALKMEYTLPEVSQSVIITRMEGRTKVPERESIRSFAAHRATMVLFLSTGLLEKLSEELIKGGYPEDTPAAIVYKASWPEEEVHHCTIRTLYETAKKHQITKTALIVVGEVLQAGERKEYERSRLYAPEFTTEFRQGTKKEGE
nr:precorrin-4 C(11)-methyltransferase [uncultured Sellimonas sp.]